MEKTIFEIAKMDCLSEENLIRMKLDGISSIKNLDFDISNRKLTVFHNGQIDQIENNRTQFGWAKNQDRTNQSNRIFRKLKSEKTSLDCSRYQLCFLPNRNDQWTDFKINGIGCG